MADQKNKRTVYNVQDVISGQTGRTHPKFKSGYSGPKKPPRSQAGTGVPVSSGVTAPTVVHRSGGILDYAWIAYCLILVIALTVSVVFYAKGGSNRDGIYYPHHIFTITGVVRDIFDDYRNGGLGSGAAAEAASGQAAASETAADAGDAGSEGETDTSALLGDNATTSVPNSTTGATMALDVGSAYGSYSTATSHEMLLTQLDQALAANDTGFVGMKLAYEDAESKSLIGYPESVVAHFTQYMADNPDKRANFLAEIKDEAAFSAKNGSAFLVKLPLLQFTINMGYDGTTISISGFADQKMDSGQSAIVSPLLPCMYTIRAETAKGSQTSEVECNMNEGNLKINIGVTNN